MTEPARKLIEEALRLPSRDRAEVAAELLASLDGEPEPDVEAAWAREIEARVRRVEAGDAEFSDWADVLGDLRPRE